MTLRGFHRTSGPKIIWAIYICFDHHEVHSLYASPSGSRLDIILGLSPSNADAPFAELEVLYINILFSVSDIKRTMSILGFLMLSNTLQAKLTTTIFIEDLLMLSRGDSHIFAGELASVLTLGPAKSGVHKTVDLLHTSLSDFLLDRSRLKQFNLDPPEVYAHLVCMCLRALGRFFVGELLKDQTVSFYDSVQNYSQGLRQYRYAQAGISTCSGESVQTLLSRCTHPLLFELPFRNSHTIHMR